MRRVHVSQLNVGDLQLSAEESHHLRDVLRVSIGDVVELFEASGRVARGPIVALSPEVIVTIDTFSEGPRTRRLTVASAVPKGDRADWMIEKLSELGVASFTPLKTTRSVVHPEGAGKLDRWRRIAVEAAKQSRRVGVMSIEPLATLDAVVRLVEPSTGIFFSTGDAPPLQRVITPQIESMTLFIGPEGGWTNDEETRLRTAGLTAAGLGPTILRIETAAILSAGLLMLLNETNNT